MSSFFLKIFLKYLMSVSYSSQKNFNHANLQKIGILLVNLGTPDAPNTKSLKKYLKQFLSDPRVIEVPCYIWFFILNFIVFPSSFTQFWVCLSIKIF